MRGARAATKVMVLRGRYSPHGKCRAAAFKATGGFRIHRQLYCFGTNPTLGSAPTVRHAGAPPHSKRRG